MYLTSLIQKILRGLWHLNFRKRMKKKNVFPQTLSISILFITHDCRKCLPMTQLQSEI